jgi:GNAT superfamily N-acetyltransferase
MVQALFRLALIKALIRYLRSPTLILGRIESFFVDARLRFDSISILKGMSIVDCVEDELLIIRGCSSLDQSLIADLYLKFNRVPLSSRLKKLYSEYGEKLIVVAQLRGTAEIVGLDMFYFNQRDIAEGTVHEGFIGVLPRFEGAGIATRMRNHALWHFKRSGFQGVSTRISRSNIGSLSSAEKLGFNILDEYSDISTGEDRYYLVCDLQEFNSAGF